MALSRRIISNTKWRQIMLLWDSALCSSHIFAVNHCMRKRENMVLSADEHCKRFFHANVVLYKMKDKEKDNWMKTGVYVYEMVHQLHYYSNTFKECAALSEIEIKEKVEYIVEALGCYQAEILERPKVLLMDRDEIEYRIHRLHSCGQDRLSVPLLDLVDSNQTDSQLTKAITQYLSTMGSYGSNVQFLNKKLGCSELQIMEIFKSYNKRIFTKLGKKNSKLVDLLLGSGVTNLDCIRSHPSVFDRSLSWIEARLKYLRGEGIRENLPVFYFTLTKSAFEYSIEKFKERDMKNTYDASKDLEQLDLSEKDRALVEEILRQHEARQFTNFPKIKLLISNGISLRDIVNHSYILDFSLSTLSNQLTSLQEAGMDKIHVSQIVQYISRRKISKTKLSQRLLASLMKCHISHLQSYSFNVVGELNQGEQRIAENIEFLLSQGFTKKDIQEVPIVLGHDTEILCQYWFSLPTNLNTYHLCMNDPIKLLNGLQYTIEKDMNFKSLVAVKMHDN